MPRFLPPVRACHSAVGLATAIFITTTASRVTRLSRPISPTSRNRDHSGWKLQKRGASALPSHYRRWNYTLPSDRIAAMLRRLGGLEGMEKSFRTRTHESYSKGSIPESRKSISWSGESDLLYMGVTLHALRSCFVSLLTYVRRSIGANSSN